MADKRERQIKIPSGVLAKIKRGKPASFVIEFELESRRGVMHLRGRLLPPGKEGKR